MNVVAIEDILKFCIKLALIVRILLSVKLFTVLILLSAGSQLEIHVQYLLAYPC